MENRDKIHDMLDDITIVVDHLLMVRYKLRTALQGEPLHTDDLVDNCYHAIRLLAYVHTNLKELE